MVKVKKDDTTEDKILEAAKKVFISKGMTGARMQDIADEAGMNKALLHYYFRSKEKLFERIFSEAAGELFPHINQVFNSDQPLFEKIQRFCESYLDIIIKNPYLPLFVLNEINRDPSYFFANIWKRNDRPDPGKFLAQVEKEVKKGTIKKINPFHLLLNLLSMTIFPFVARPMIQKTIGMNEARFRQMMEERKKEIPRFIIDSIKK